MALVVAGLEHVAEEEIIERFGLSRDAVHILGLPPPSAQWAPGGGSTLFAGAAGVAKVGFVLPEPHDWDELRESLALLKSPQCVLALVGCHSGVPFEAKACEAWLTQVVCKDPGWASALFTWRKLRRTPPELPTFRASAVRDGQHTFEALHIARVIADAVYDLHGSEPHLFGAAPVSTTEPSDVVAAPLVARMVGFDLEVVGLVLQQESMCALRERTRAHLRSHSGAPPLCLLKL